MKTEIKKYMPIGGLRLINVKVIRIDLNDLVNNDIAKGNIIYEGAIEEATNEIKNMYYYKLELGSTALAYVCD